MGIAGLNVLKFYFYFANIIFYLFLPIHISNEDDVTGVVYEKLNISWLPDKYA